jgi:7,8-dihydropterin-6-yl-methyl-4-(beta-D-ribofuranosyl)aminobenzene 5'-phosphate synthase
MTAAALREVEAAEITVLVDNVTDLLSTTPRWVGGELARSFRPNSWRLSGEELCCASWGLSLSVALSDAGGERRLLFDCGPEAYALERNLQRLEIAAEQFEEIVLSHGHWDHCGGLLAALALQKSAGRSGTPVHVNPDMFASRGLSTPKGAVVAFRDVPGPEAIAAAGGRPVNDPAPRLLLDGRAWLSGEIPRTTAYEQGLPGHVRREGETWQPDPWIVDERCLVVHLKDRGLLVFTACSHAGLVNVLRHARESFPGVPLYSAFGGFHLSGAACEKIIPETVADLHDFGLQRIVAGHCTGWRATHRLVEAFGEEVVVPSAVGRTYRF